MLENCKKCNKPLDRKGRICRLCKYETNVYTLIRTNEENRSLKEDFKKNKPQIFEEIRKKVLAEIQSEKL
jgi:predicted amidophosphoribosyltransferase